VVPRGRPEAAADSNVVALLQSTKLDEAQIHGGGSPQPKERDAATYFQYVSFD
jgi:hypothetical protein